MVDGPMVYGARTSFPSGDDSLKFGWEFLKSDFLRIATIDALGLLVLVAAVVPVVAVVQPAGLMAALVTLLWVLIVAMVSLTVTRRGLDFWDEANERVAARSYGAAIGDAFAGARRGYVAWIGYNIALGIGSFVVMLPLRAVVSSRPSSGQLVLVALVTFVALLVLATYLVLVAPLCADGHGEAMSESWRLVRSEFQGVFATLVRLAVVAAVAYLPVIALSAALPSPWLVVPVSFVYVVGMQALGIGAVVNMYRSFKVPK